MSMMSDVDLLSMIPTMTDYMMYDSTMSTILWCLRLYDVDDNMVHDVDDSSIL